MRYGGFVEGNSFFIGGPAGFGPEGSRSHVEYLGRKKGLGKLFYAKLSSLKLEDEIY